jgi:hypothetical protein
MIDLNDPWLPHSLPGLYVWGGTHGTNYPTDWPSSVAFGVCIMRVETRVGNSAVHAKSDSAGQSAVYLPRKMDCQQENDLAS